MAEQWIVYVSCILAVLISLTFSFELEGSSSSFAKFTKWNPCENGSIKFEFKTEQPNGLLLYTDDGGKFDFFEVKLIGGMLRLRVNFGEGMATVLNVGDNLNDNRWHQVVISRKDAGLEVEVAVDSIKQLQSLRGTKVKFGERLESNGYLYIGGLPVEFMVKLNELALPSVLFEPRFRGGIRNLLISNCSDKFDRPIMLDSQGVRTNDLDSCRLNNPCQNNGICVSTDKGPVCDCSEIDFQGKHCETEKIPSQATFFGQEYLSYDLRDRGDPILSSDDEISLFFKTRQTDGLLFYTGDGKDYLIVTLNSGHIHVVINLGSGMFDTTVKGAQFNDNRWHHVSVKRKSRKIYVEVDGSHRESGTTTGVFSMLSSNELYVGGRPDSLGLGKTKGSLTNNFRGCLKKVTYKADSISLDITELGKNRHDLIAVHGDIVFDKCEDLAHSLPITFTTPETFVKAPTWDAKKSGEISFQFQTNERNGVLMYNNGIKATSDFFAMEIVDGFLYLILDLGSGAIKVQAGTKLVSDGLPHKVMLKHNGKTGSIDVDGVKMTYTAKGNSDQLDLDGDFYVGGISDSQEANLLPRELWSGKLHYGYVGCMQDFVMNGKFVDLGRIAADDGVKGITEECLQTAEQCPNRPCSNGAVCKEGWNRFVCDCSATSYSGATCTEAAATLTFDGKQYLKVTLPDESRTEAEDISLRFKTMRQYGLLFATTSLKTADKMVVSLDDGRVRLDINLGSGGKTLIIGNGLSDDTWHTVHIRRRLQNIQLRVDRDQVENDIDGSSRILQFNEFDLGTMQGDEPRSKKNIVGFVGQMQQFIFNNNHFMEMAKAGAKNVETTAAFNEAGPQATCDPDACQNNGVCIQNWDAYTCDCDMTSFTGPACADESVSYSFGSGTGLITFTYPEGENPNTKVDHLALGFMTTEENAVLLKVVSGNSNDYIEVEINEGSIIIVYNMGTMAHPIGKLFTRVNDGKYHVIKFTRNGPNAELQLDDLPKQTKEPDGTQLSVFNNQAQIYVGGKKASDGSIERPFKGIISGIVFNKLRILDLANNKDPRITMEGDVQEQKLNILPSSTTPSSTRPDVATPPNTASMQSTMGIKTTTVPTTITSITTTTETTTMTSTTKKTTTLKTTPKRTTAQKKIFTSTTTTPEPETTTSGLGYTTDDIIFSGGSSGRCPDTDDEDCMDDVSGSGDDLVVATVKVTVNPSIPDLLTTSTNTPCKEDDEELCIDGSGMSTPPVDESKSSPTAKATTKQKTTPDHSQSTKSTSKVVTESTTTKTTTQKGTTQKETKPVTKKLPGDTGATSQDDDSMFINIPLIVGIAVGVLVALCIVIFIVYKLKKRSNGSYKIDESKNYADSKKPLQNGENGHRVKSNSSPAKTKKGDVKEWYV